jgi:hypothetical protein
MRIRCAFSKTKRFPIEISSPLCNVNFDENPFLILKEYNVYAMEIWNDKPVYYVCDHEFGFLPPFIPAKIPCSFCEIIDDRLSRYWVFWYNKNLKVAMWAFPEWAGGWECINEPDEYVNEGFYDRMMNGKQSDIKIFDVYKEAIDMEYPNHLVSERAKILDEEWLQCPFCLDAWKSVNAMNAMVKCPSCQYVAHHPRYNPTHPYQGLLPIFS